MKEDIYKNLKLINQRNRLSLKYLSTLSKLNYETIRTKIKRNSDLSEEEMFQIVMNYNLTFKQLEELKKEEKYHKMIDQNYYWNIIHYVNSAIISKQSGLNQIGSILSNADGDYSYFNHELVFKPKYNINDYLKYSTSIVMINRYKKLHNNPIDPLSSAIEEEISIVNKCVSKINNSFSKDLLKDIFIYKYVLALSAKEIQNKLSLNSSKYYRLLAETNEIGFKAFGLYTNHEIQRKISCVSNT